MTQKHHLKTLHYPITLLHSLQRFVLIGLFGMLSVVISVQIYNHYDNFSAIADTLRSQNQQKQQEMIKREVQRVVERIEYRKAKLKDLAAATAAARIDQVVLMVRNMLHQKEQEFASDTVRTRILETLSAIRFNDEQGYIFVLDERGEVIMHPQNPELVGQSLLQRRDSRGKLFVKDLVALVSQQGDGSMEYTFTKPGQQGADFSKLSHADLIPELGWIIGTGVYLDDLEAEEKSSILSELQLMRYAKNGYLFVDDWTGVVLAHGAQPSLVGKNIWDYQDSHGKKVVQQLIAAAKTSDGDFVHYWWRKPDTGSERPKVSFSMGIHDWQWMIGTGVYTDDVEAAIAELEQTFLERTLANILGTLAGGGCVGLLLIFWMRRIYAALYTDFEHFRDFFARAATSEALMDEHVLQFGEFRHQASHVNRMLQDKLEAQNRLRDQQIHLEQLVAERTHRLEEKTQELARMASTDPLTGLLNRRSFSDQALCALREMKRSGGQCSLVLLDIDHFKVINDQYGHGTGDEILQTVAERIKSQLREVDLLGRWGGEEFTILLPQTSLKGAVQLCGRMQGTLSGTGIGPARQISASFGVTAWRDKESLDALIARADQAMYAAKKAGRNRIETAP
jgi:diguanylate cyclase (GGDEF)-like protein